MSSDTSDNIGSANDLLAGSTATQPVPETTAPDDPEKTITPGDVGGADDAAPTWVPGQDDPDATRVPEHGDADATLAPGQDDAVATLAPDSDRGPDVPADPEATCGPVETSPVADVWGEDFGETRPDQTLKNPRDAKSPAHASDRALSDDDGPPDLSAKGYDLLDVLGEGGVGIVYQAVQKSVERKIAIKMIKPSVGESAAQREKFISEAVVTGQLDHPNIVPIHDLDATVDDQPFYTMKMVRGVPWGDAYRDKTLTENLHILLAVCDAISFAHSKGVIHRDLKPDNVMLGEFGEVQVMDWGLGAAVSNDGEVVDPSRTQSAGGTPAYMAPEMVTGEDAPVGTHSDVYLLGAILYQIITGKPPHGGKRVLDALENAHNNVIQPTESTGAPIDIALEAMQTEPADRYASVKDFEQALREYESHGESINMSRRSSDELHRARDEQDYELFAQALFGFREALNLWEDNAEAATGVTEAQLQYAGCAFEKGDLDLARSTLDGDCATHEALAAEIEVARHKRDIAKRRLKLFRVTAISLTAAVIVILAVASLWIYSAKRQAVVAKEAAVEAKVVAVVAKEAAVSAKEAEAEQRQLAESATTKAKEEETRAVKALGDLERAYADLVESQEQEKRARAQAKASREAATKSRDELAKTGMLRDNSWWVFDTAAARKAQNEAAEAIGKPVELTLKLSDDVELVMVLIPPGEFVMGSPPEEEDRAADEHLHRVHHTETFYLGKFELTEVQWQALVGKLPASVVDRDADPTLPAIGVSYEQIIRDLLPTLEERAPDGYTFRLPSEAEWEYVCRAGTASTYHTGDGEDALDSAGWFLSNSDRKVQPVGGKAPNAFGLHDMHGNASEICADQYAPGFYLESSVENPMFVGEGEIQVVRGGSVFNMPDHCRSAYRSNVYSKNEYPFLGLRLALIPVRAGSPVAESAPAESAPAPAGDETSASP